MGADHGHHHHAHHHAHSHAHHHAGPAAPSPVSSRARWATLAVVVPLAVATVAALVWLWPAGREPAAAGQAPLQRVTGTVETVTPKPCPELPAEVAGQAPAAPDTCGIAEVVLTGGPETGRRVRVELPSGPGSQDFAAGDDVIMLHTPGGGALDAPPYQITDHDRAVPLWLCVAAFALAVIAFGRWRGVTALAGLAVTFVLLLLFVIPAIMAGESPLLVAIVGAAAIMLAVLYLTHGFSVTTSTAVLGTLASLCLTGVLSSVAIGFTDLSGVTDDSSFLLDMSYRIDTEGLLLAGIIIGSLGVLDDVTVTQAVTVAELARANPSFGFRQLYRAGGRVGRAHVASVINTIILAYSGASLPLLLLVSLGEQPIGEILASPTITQEIIRSIAGTLGLIAAVPLTTALAALACGRRGRDGDRVRRRHRDDHDVPAGAAAARPEAIFP